MCELDVSARLNTFQQPSPSFELLRDMNVASVFSSTFILYQSCWSATTDLLVPQSKIYNDRLGERSTKGLKTMGVGLVLDVEIHLRRASLELLALERPGPLCSRGDSWRVISPSDLINQAYRHWIALPSFAWFRGHNLAVTWTRAFRWSLTFRSTNYCR